MLQASESPLWETYDLAMLDLDGVVYIGLEAVQGASAHLDRARAAGMRLAFVTNNAARPPTAVAEHLRELGVPAGPEDVVTSAQAAARILADRCDSGAAVFVIGGEGLFEALEERGLRPVQDVAAAPVAVVSGYHRDLRWGTVSDGAILVGRGLPWVAANTDISIPTPHGRGPGNGVLVETVARFAGATPVVAGKPLSPLFEETVRRVGGTRPLVVGDRLDTDIEGAVNGGYDSLLVLTGVTGLEELVAAPSHQRPSYLSSDLGGLAARHPQPRLQAGGSVDETDATDTETTVDVAGMTARIRHGRLQVEGKGLVDDWWRAVACAAWRHLDTTGVPVSLEGLQPPGSVSTRNDDAAPSQPTGEHL